MMRLTDEQRRVVADNHNLIYDMLNRNNWSIDEYYDVAAIGLCRAAVGFDPAKGFTFSTYAGKVIINAVLCEQRKSMTAMRQGVTVSFDDPIPYTKGELTLGDMIAGGTEPQDTALCNAAEAAIEKLKPKERMVLRLTMAGYRQVEIAAMTGVSRAYISHVLADARRNLQYLA
jgi:RNA polymerase sigma factor (sigma-70 family)